VTDGVDHELDAVALWAEFLALGAVPDQEFDHDRATELVTRLNEPGAPEVVEWALPLLSGVDPWHREAAAWVLMQHGFPEGRPFAALVLPHLVAAAGQEPDPDVRGLMVDAIGRSEMAAAAPELMWFADDPEPWVRQKVAANLATLFEDELSAPAVTCLLTLTRDDDPAVRNWATFALGTQSDADGPEIRQAFRDRLADGDALGATRDEVDAAAEAAMGLARRHDPAVRPWLDRQLARPEHEVGNLVVEAAGELGDPGLVAALVALEDAGWHLHPDEPHPGSLREAIDALRQAAG